MTHISTTQSHQTTALIPNASTLTTNIKETTSQEFSNYKTKTDSLDQTA